MPTDDRFTLGSISAITRSALWPPRLTSAESAWNEHVPFAGWIVEATQPDVLVELGTHVGVSYFAFCETVSRLEMSTRCYAVDTWQGDEHAGFYGEDVFSAVETVNEERYNSFSRLLRSTFDAAVDEFDDGSIDLLHIDGLHTYEAVKHDFQTWLPKLSDRSVVLFHDTNERKADFGVYRLLAELAEEYPVFEFLHEHGLGVVCFGSHVPEAVLALVGLADDEERRDEFRGAYEALGRRLSAEITVEKLSRDARKRDEKLGELSAAIKRRDASIVDLAAAVGRREDTIDGLTAALDRRESTIADLRAAVERRAQSVDDLTKLTQRREEAMREMASTIVEQQDDVETAVKEAESTRRAMDRLVKRRSIRLALTVSKAFRPLFRFIRNQKKPAPQVRSTHIDFEAEAQGTAEVTQKEPEDSQIPVPLLRTVIGAEAVTIIVPIFNAPDELETCLRSLMRNTNGDARLLLIDDASTDPRISTIIERYALLPRVEFLRNSQNLGFVETVNRGFDATSTDVVVLNSDVEVTPNWLDRLKTAARIAPNAGTVTPLSDNAGAFSAPTMGEHNETPMSLTRDQVGRLVAQWSRRTYPEAPTGNGFCMFIRRGCLDDVGPFDAEAFPRGYGEENDFCMRALANGWINVIDDATYVFHTRSASFGDEKFALMESGRAVLDERYPQYGSLVREFVSSSEMVQARQHIGKAFRNVAGHSSRPRPRLLFVLHGAGGGTPATTADLIEGLDGAYESLVLLSNGRVLTLFDHEHGERREIEHWRLSQSILVTDTTNREYAEIVESLLIRYQIEAVHIRHLIGHTFELPGIAQSLGIPVVLSFHDFYYICPTVHLMDNNDRFCGGKCSRGQGNCPLPTPWLDDVPYLKHAWVYDWQDRARRLFADVDVFVTASEDTRNHYFEVFPELENRDVRVINHGRQMTIATDPVGVEPDADTPVRILLAGNISLHKGSRFVRELIDLDSAGRLEFHVLGRVGDDLEPLVEFHGAYERDDFESKARAVGPSFVGMFSTTAESFSHVLTESWAAGIPVLASDLGALGERIGDVGGGWLVDIDDPVGAYERIVSIASDESDYREQRRLALRAATASSSLGEMSMGYAEIYGMLRGARLAFATSVLTTENPNVIRVGVFLPSGTSLVATPSSHVRVLRNLMAHDQRGTIVWALLTAERFVNGDGGAADIDVALVQRTAIPPEISESFIARCAALDVNIVYEIDDDLLSDDPQWSELDSYSPHRASIQALLNAARLVTVSTPALAERFAVGDERIAVIENRLDRSLWLSSELFIESEAAERRVGLHDDPLKLLFVGGPSHADDLEIVRPALDLIGEMSGRRVVLSVVGGVPPSEEEHWFETVEIPANCRQYPQFVTWVRSIVGRFDVAVAPLADTPLNRSKSDLRFLEYSAMGLPGVYSDTNAFSSVSDGETGLVVDNSPEAWAEAIVRLRDDSELQDKIRREAHSHVISSRLIGESNDRFGDLLWSAGSTSHQA